MSKIRNLDEAYDTLATVVEIATGDHNIAEKRVKSMSVANNAIGKIIMGLAVQIKASELLKDDTIVSREWLSSKPQHQREATKPSTFKVTIEGLDT